MKAPPMLCDDQDGWDGGEWEGDLREREYICIYDSLQCTEKNNTTLYSNYTSTKKKWRNRREEMEKEKWGDD